LDGSDFFNRSWEEFKVGFNDSNGNYWLGNELLSQLNSIHRYKLRFDLQLRNFSWYWAEYSLFVVSNEATNYTMTVGGYSGNAGDGFRVHDRVMFTTYDRDNDRTTDRNCAVYNGGGFWYRTCGYISVNTVRGRGNNFRWYSDQTGPLLLLSSRMWLMCK